MDLPDVKKLSSLITMLKKQGVLQYQSTELNLVFAESVVMAASQGKVKSLAEEAMGDEPELSEDAELERLIAWNDKPAIPES
jgi:hypothetical protein